MIVKVTALLSLALEIIILEDKFDDAKVDSAPSMVKLPALPRVSASTSPSASATTEFKPFTKRAINIFRRTVKPSFDPIAFWTFYY